MEYFVYIVECSDKSYYVGVTNDIEKRISEHNLGIDQMAYTYNKRPVKLMFYDNYANPFDAIAKEKQIKGWSRAKKEALIKKDWDKLIKLSKNKSSKKPSFDMVRQAHHDGWDDE